MEVRIAVAISTISKGSCSVTIWCGLRKLQTLQKDEHRQIGPRFLPRSPQRMVLLPFDTCTGIKQYHSDRNVPPTHTAYVGNHSYGLFLTAIQNSDNISREAVLDRERLLPA